MPSPLLYLTAVIFVGVLAQAIAWRIKLPAILLLLALGFTLGRWAEPETYIPDRLLSAAISLSVAVILFEGGLSLKLRELSESGSALLRLTTLGAALTWLCCAWASRLLVFDTLQVAALAGAIYIVTGPTVIGPLLRHVRPRRRVAAVAKWEGIVIDPIGASMAVLVYEAILAQGPGSGGGHGFHCSRKNRCRGPTDWLRRWNSDYSCASPPFAARLSPCAPCC